MGDREILTDIGDQLTSARKKWGYTQERLAELTGLDFLSAFDDE